MARQIAKHSSSFEDFREGFGARLTALGKTHDLLIARTWEGVAIRDIVETQIAPFIHARDDRLSIDGPDLVLWPKAVEALALCLHELATNATKYGALTVPDGSIAIRWTVQTNDRGVRQLRFEWRERSRRDPVVPDRRGFGHVILTRLAPTEFDGKAELDFSSDGLTWTLEAPMARISAVVAEAPERSL